MPPAGGPRPPGGIARAPEWGKSRSTGGGVTLIAWWTLAVLVASIGLIIWTRIGAELVLLGALIVLLLSGVLTPEQALAGFSNPGVITVALMFVIVAGIRETGGVEFLVSTVLGRPRGVARAQARLMLPTLLISGFLNNTPVVATFIPAVLVWSRRLGLTASRLLIPLSYASILGGTSTLIGTSTNLAVNGLWTARTGDGLGMFEISWVGVPVALAGLAYVLLFGRRLLPDRKPPSAGFANPREYTVEMRVREQGPLVGKTIEEAGLRHLQGLFLVEIDRGGTIIPSVSSTERLQSGDHLVFAGVTESVVELHKIAGLEPATQTFDLRNPDRRLVEVAIAPKSDLAGRTIREGRFRSTFGASVIAVARHGERMRGKIGDIRLEPSDTLLIEADPSFLERHRHSRDFLMMSELPDSHALRHERAWLSWLILGGVVLSAALGWVDILKATMAGAALMLLTGCCSPAAARRNIDTSILLAIAAAFGLGAALEVSGVASAIAGGLLALAGDNLLLLLICTYLATTLLTELVTNNATAVLMFPIVIAATESAGANPLPFVIAIMMGASASFATPIGYQTNLMVYGPGGYRFSDYLRFGLPLNILCGVVTVLVAPLVWPLQG
jgi:di/tricarboxylate transporter